MKKIAVISVARSDYGILRPILRALQTEEECDLQLIVGGAHLDAAFGSSIDEINADQMPIFAFVPVSASADDGQSAAEAFGNGVSGFCKALNRLKPDIVVVLGDRFEMFAAATACVFLDLPLAHIHGGELTFGAMDDVFRHSITKMAHLHFTSTVEYARRVHQLGEEPWRITVSGAPGLDNLREISLLSRDEMQLKFGKKIADNPLVVTFHPVTRELAEVKSQGKAVVDALIESGFDAIITAPNADPGGRALFEIFRVAVEENSQLQMVENLGTQGYFSLMTLACAMVGNSSSGIIEAASFGLPVVNIGSRQEGRVSPQNVVHCKCEKLSIEDAIRIVTSDDFRKKNCTQPNPYGDGNAAARIVRVLMDTPIDLRLMKKQFIDVAMTQNDCIYQK